MLHASMAFQSGPTTSASAASSTAYPRSTHVRALGIVVWIMMLLVPFWSQTDWRTRHDNWETSTDRPVQLAAFLLGGLAQLTAGPQLMLQGITRFLFQLSGCLWSIAFVNILVLSVFSIHPVESALYVCFTATGFLVAAVAWEDNGQPVSQWLGRTGWLICAYMGILCLRLGWNGITIGGMQHNQVASTFFTALVCFQFLPRRWRILGTLPVLAVIGCTSSRSTLLTAIVFLALILALRPWRKTMLLWLGLGIASISLLVAVDHLLQTGIAWAFVDSVLAFSDSARGLQSGFTGRTALWRDGWVAFLDNPLIGYGFRTRSRIVEDLVSMDEVNAHNGYLNLLLDAGILGALPIMGAVVCSAFRFLNWLVFASVHPEQHSSVDREQGKQLCRIAVALILSSLVGWVFEPAYLNLGASHTVLLIVILSVSTHGAGYVCGSQVRKSDAKVAVAGVPC